MEGEKHGNKLLEARIINKVKTRVKICKNRFNVQNILKIRQID